MRSRATGLLPEIVRPDFASEMPSCEETRAPSPRFQEFPFAVTTSNDARQSVTSQRKHSNFVTALALSFRRGYCVCGVRGFLEHTVFWFLVGAQAFEDRRAQLQATVFTFVCPFGEFDLCHQLRLNVVQPA